MEFPFNFPIDITGLFPAGAAGMTPIVIVVGFIAFILVFKAVLGFVKNMLLVAAASAIFPFLLAYLGYSMPITPMSIAGFVILGIGLYIAVSIVKFIFGFRKK